MRDANGMPDSYDDWKLATPEEDELGKGYRESETAEEAERFEDYRTERSWNEY